MAVTTSSTGASWQAAYDAINKIVNRRLEASVDDSTSVITDIENVLIPESVTRSSLIIHIFRSYARNAQDSPQLEALIDLSLFICKEHTSEESYLIPNYVPFLLIEEWLSVHTWIEAERIWTSLMEPRTTVWASQYSFNKRGSTKASLILLRLCNQFLKRLSKNAVLCGRILAFLAQTFSLSERSGVNLHGRANVANVTYFDEESEFEVVSDEAKPTTEDEEEEGAVVAGVDYKLYKMFWSVQRFHREFRKASESAAHWESYVKEMDIVLGAFEGNAFSEDDLGRAREKKRKREENDGPTTSGNEEQKHFFQAKYLTQSRLLPLQLHDPRLRECMLTQFLILIEHLVVTALPENDIKTPKSKLLEFQDRIKKLMCLTPPDGPEFYKMLTKVLQRERNWVLWKQEKCPVYEKSDLVQPSKTSTNNNIAATAKPTKIMNDILSKSMDDDPFDGIDDPKGTLPTPLPELMEDFTEAWDPENDIDEEYWPSHNDLHCWRTMRGTMECNIGAMENATDGTDAIVEKVLNIKKPTKEAVADNNDSENKE